MTFFNSILLSGWFQIILLSLGFFVYSQGVLRRGLIRGYALGWLIGLFFIFTYTAVNPPQTVQIGGFDRELNVLQIIFSSVMGIFVSLGMALISTVLRDSYRWQALKVAGITGVLVTAIFIQVIAQPEIRLMVSIFVLASAMTALFALILRRDKDGSQPTNTVSYTEYGQQENADQPTSRVGRMRQRIVDRINRNDVPTDRSIYPQ